MAMLGPNLGLTDLAQVMEINELCNRLGMDTISSGALIAYLMDGFESVDLKASQFDFSIDVGETDKAMELIRMIANRTGDLGNLLADGIDACRRVGCGARHRVAFHRAVGTQPHGRAGDDAVVLHLHGHVSGRHGHADHCDRFPADRALAAEPLLRALEL